MLSRNPSVQRVRRKQSLIVAMQFSNYTLHRIKMSSLFSCCRLPVAVSGNKKPATGIHWNHLKITMYR